MSVLWTTVAGGGGGGGGGGGWKNGVAGTATQHNSTGGEPGAGAGAAPGPVPVPVPVPAAAAAAAAGAGEAPRDKRSGNKRRSPLAKPKAEPVLNGTA